MFVAEYNPYCASVIAEKMKVPVVGVTKSLVQVISL